MGALESGQTFLAGVLAKLPTEQQAQAKAIFDAAEAKDAVTLLGDGALARSDYSRNMDTLREKEQALNEYYGQLNTWFADNKTALDRAKELEGKGTPPAGTPPTGTPPAGTPPLGDRPPFSPEDIRRVADEAINEAGRDYIAVSAYFASIASQHQAMFGEPLNALELVQNPKVGKPIAGQPGRVYSLQDAYNERHGERVAAKHKEAEDKRFNDEVDRRLQERIKTTSTHPFPLRQESSPLDVLSSKDGPAAHNLDSAVAEYDRLQASRGM